MLAGAGISELDAPAAAAAEAARAALAGVDGRADAALLFATPAYGKALPDLVNAAGDVLGVGPVGASAQGVLAAGRELERGCGVAVLALSGLRAHPFLLPELRDEEDHVGEELAAQLGRAPRASDLVVLLPDPYALAPGPLLCGVTQALAPARVVGAGAVGSVDQPPLQWCGDEVTSGALAGLVLEAPQTPRIGITQACQPVTPLLRVTRTDGHWILGLDGKPALDVFREVARGPLAEDLRRAAGFLFAALPQAKEDQASEALASGDYLVRNLVGFSPERRAIAMAEPVRSGQCIALALREPHGARDDLKRMLAGLDTQSARLALYFNCCARGESLFGMAGLEAAYLQEALSGVPTVGMLGAYEIGPLRGRPELLTYTGVLTLLDSV